MRSIFSTRAQKNDMLRREQDRLTMKLGHYLDSLGGQVEDVSDSWARSRAVSIETLAGRLSVTCYGNWLACRFESVKMAKRLLSHGPGERMNSHSGKWNFHFGRVTAEEALAEFRAELEPILPKGDGP